MKRAASPSPSPQDRDPAAASAAIDERAFRDHCQRVCFAYDDHYRPVEDEIERAAIPADGKKALRAHYAKEFLVEWPCAIGAHLYLSDHHTFRRKSG